MRKLLGRRAGGQYQDKNKNNHFLGKSLPKAMKKSSKSTTGSFFSPKKTSTTSRGTLVYSEKVKTDFADLYFNITENADNDVSYLGANASLDSKLAKGECSATGSGRGFSLAMNISHKNSERKEYKYKSKVGLLSAKKPEINPEFKVDLVLGRSPGGSGIGGSALLKVADTDATGRTSITYKGLVYNFELKFTAGIGAGGKVGIKSMKNKSNDRVNYHLGAIC